jgi:hypothetical protein
MHVHFEALEIVELLPDDGLVAGREARPGLVGAPVVFLRLRHLDVVVEANDLHNKHATSTTE